MADLAAGDVTVTLPAAEQEFLGVGKKITFPSIAFGDASKTYPAGGVPLPAIGNFGMKKAISRLLVTGGGVAGVNYWYDRANHKLKMFWGDYSASSDGVHAEYVGAPASATLEAIVFGS